MRRVRLAPLEPDAFLRWGFANGGPHAPHDTPLTLEDIAFELQGVRTLEELHRDYVKISARVRYNQRCGLDPWTGGVH